MNLNKSQKIRKLFPILWIAIFSLGYGHSVHAGQYAGSEEDDASSRDPAAVSKGSPGQTVDFQAKISQATAEEMSSVENDLKKELAAVKQKIAGLEQARAKVISTSQANAVSDEKGIQFIEKYIKLLQVRYVNDKGAFEPNLQVNERDQKNINVIFANYLDFSPLKGKTSTGVAVQKLNEAQDSLKKKILALSKPDILNNSELAILKSEEDKYQERVKVLMGLSTRFGLSLEDGTDAVASSSAKTSSVQFDQSKQKDR